MSNQKVTVESKDDNIYFNISIVNNTGIDQKATFTQQLTNSILKNPEEYYLTVARFNIDGSALPLFIFADNTYYVSLEYNSFIATQVVSAPPNPYYGFYALPYGSNAVYSYTDFLNAINLAYSQALVTLNGLIPLPAGITAPYFLYDNSTGIISLYSDGRFYEDNVGLPVTIWMNYTLFQFFSNFVYNFRGEGLPDKLDIRFKVLNLYNSNTSTLNSSIPPNFIKMSQEGSNNSTFWEPTTISFKTNRIGVRRNIFREQIILQILTILRLQVLVFHLIQ